MSLSSKFQKTKSLILQYYWIAFIPVLIYFILHSFSKDEEINKNKSYAFALVLDSKPILNKASKRRYDYQFFYKGEKYNGSSVASLFDNVALGNFYKVEFSDKNPDYNRIIFEEEYIAQIQKNDSGIVDTIYILKSKLLKQRINNKIKNIKAPLDSIKD